MQVRDWNPKDGMAFQGDVALVSVPDDIEVNTLDEIAPIDGRLILQEGEITGHHHAITLDPSFGRERHFRKPDVTVADPLAGASPALRKRLSGGTKPAASVHMYRDAAAARAMVRAGILERADLAVGFLVVEGVPVTVQHEEHDAIRVPAGRFYVGRQVESVGAGERRVAD